MHAQLGSAPNILLLCFCIPFPLGYLVYGLQFTAGRCAWWVRECQGQALNHGRPRIKTGGQWEGKARTGSLSHLVALPFPSRLQPEWARTLLVGGAVGVLPCYGHTT